MSNYNAERDERDDEYMSLLRDIRRMARRIDDVLERGCGEHVSAYRLELARGIYYRMDDVMEYMREYPDQAEAGRA